MKSKPPVIRKQGPVIAIDGPAGTGKSTATKRLAEALGFVHVDTGALYRAIALLSIQKLEAPRSDAALLDKACEIAQGVHLEFKRDKRKNPSNRILANGADLTDFIRTPEVSMTSSKVSAHPVVRKALLQLQRRLGAKGKAILEGRDIGTVIFPDADVKFFLSASADERAKRRLIELEASGVDAPSFDEIRRQILERDKADSTRAVAPLKKASDAIALDTSDMSLDEVVLVMTQLVKSRLAKARARQKAAKTTAKPAGKPAAKSTTKKAAARRAPSSRRT